MTAEQVFAAANMMTLLTWAGLLLAPRRRMVVTTVAGAVVPVLLACAYTIVMVSAWSGANGGFSSLRAVALLFDNDWLLLAGWMHYLAFDLLVGRWELLDSQQRGISHFAVLPCLIATFLFGPAGWLLYLTLRTIWTEAQKRAPAAGSG